jgi:hypothetical protein
MTMDVDLTVEVPEKQEKELIKKIGEEFRIPIENPVDFVKRIRVLPILTKQGVKIDVIFAGLDYERTALKRASMVTLPSGTRARLATAEDLIIHKAISKRSRDWEDIDKILMRRGASLDRRYILGWLTELAGLMDQPDIVKNFEKLWKKHVLKP